MNNFNSTFITTLTQLLPCCVATMVCLFLVFFTPTNRAEGASENTHLCLYSVLIGIHIFMKCRMLGVNLQTRLLFCSSFFKPASQLQQCWWRCRWMLCTGSSETPSADEASLKEKCSCATKVFFVIKKNDAKQEVLSSDWMFFVFWHHYPHPSLFRYAMVQW